jgi:hypothetical protein
MKSGTMSLNPCLISNNVVLAMNNLLDFLHLTNIEKDIIFKNFKLTIYVSNFLKNGSKTNFYIE